MIDGMTHFRRILTEHSHRTADICRCGVSVFAAEFRFVAQSLPPGEGAPEGGG